MQGILVGAEFNLFFACYLLLSFLVCVYSTSINKVGPLHGPLAPSIRAGAPFIVRFYG